MPLDPVVLDSLNRQITNERNNSAMYLALANRLDFSNLTGLASHMRAASADELTHAQKFSDYLIDRYAFPVVAPLESATPPDGPMLSIGTLCFAAALQREMQTTEQIKTLYDIAEQADDPQTCQFLLWFLEEQTKSEREYAELVARLQFAQGCPAAVLQIDHELGEGEK